MTADRRTFEGRMVVAITQLRAAVVLLAVALTIVAVLAASGFTTAGSATAQLRRYAAQSEQVTAQLAQDALGKAQQAHSVATAIAAVTRQTILRECRNQNANHRDAIRQVNRDFTVAARHTRTAAQRAELKANKHATELVIAKLAPLRRCVSLIHPAA